jgi:UDP-N-acetylglucosamine diphosphorylase/glucosamine-1-phosphate N-acetyltransferase
MQYILFEDESRQDLLPFTFTRPVYALRSGIFTLQDRWARSLQTEVKGSCQPYLMARYGSELRPESSLWINGKTAPDADLLQWIQELAPQSYLKTETEILAAHFSPEKLPVGFDGMLTEDLLESMSLRAETVSWEGIALRHLPDIFQQNAALIRYDFELLTKGSASQVIKDPHTRIYGADNLFVEEGVEVKAAIINAEDGPIYLGKNVSVQEGSIIHGTHALLERAVVNMGAKLRGDSTFGPYVKVGGEVGNSVIMGYANKGHEGYLGNSVLGYWSNLGADTNTSNLKNNYASVKLWNYRAERFLNTGSQFCGLMMGDHSKCGINTMFNTGTVVGVSANIFGPGYPRNFVPSFSWGGSAGFSTYQAKKAFEVAERVMARRNKSFDKVEQAILEEVFARTAAYRIWDKVK